MAFENGYHGETIACLSVSDLEAVIKNLIWIIAFHGQMIYAYTLFFTLHLPHYGSCD